MSPTTITGRPALVTVAYLVLHGRFAIRPRNLAWMIAGFGFLGVYLLPFVKYPANPPAAPGPARRRVAGGGPPVRQPAAGHRTAAAGPGVPPVELLPVLPPRPRRRPGRPL